MFVKVSTLLSLRHNYPVNIFSRLRIGVRKMSVLQILFCEPIVSNGGWLRKYK
jgi:hypothetical protein